jgi:hypothetical protein
VDDCCQHTQEAAHTCALCITHKLSAHQPKLSLSCWTVCCAARNHLKQAVHLCQAEPGVSTCHCQRLVAAAVSLLAASSGCLMACFKKLVKYWSAGSSYKWF